MLSTVHSVKGQGNNNLCTWIPRSILKDGWMCQLSSILIIIYKCWEIFFFFGLWWYSHGWTSGQISEVPTQQGPWKARMVSKPQNGHYFWINMHRIKLHYTFLSVEMVGWTKLLTVHSVLYIWSIYYYLKVEFRVQSLTLDHSSADI